MTQHPPQAERPIPTRESLLSRLKDWRDDSSWREFFHTYRRMIHGVALKSGLTEQEAEEVVQETLITVARRIPEFKYDRKVCSFKTWLMNLTRWRIIDQVRKRSASHGASHGAAPDSTQAAETVPPDLGPNDTPAENRPHPGASPGHLDQVPDPASLDLNAAWEAEWRHHLLQAALEHVKRKVSPEQFQVFHLCAFKDRSVKQAAADLGLSVTQVYLARHRVGAALKRELRRLETRLDEPGA